jgi:predicted transcriptional regulator
MMYRGRTEIISQILEAANDGGCGAGITKTKLMYKAFLSYDQLQEYLMLLIESDLLSYDSTIRKFKITEKGLTFLQAYNQIDRILKEHQV